MERNVQFCWTIAAAATESQLDGMWVSVSAVLANYGRYYMTAVDAERTTGKSQVRLRGSSFGTRTLA